MPADKKMSFDAELIEGHKGVTAVIVPFDPETFWRRKPVRFDPRRDGWLVKGTINRTRFDGYIGWRAAKKPAEFHLYEQGGHGFGMYPKETTSTGIGSMPS